MSNKRVSVIIPNYNYARFLERRFNSILNQTIRPAEIIFLDDCSTDNSIAIAEQFLARSGVPYRIVPNEANQGVFQQWLKGIELVQYEFFWIAEADDYCELNFLETLLSAFDDPNVVLSYCQSKLVDGNGNAIIDDSDLKEQFTSKARWQENFFNNGLNEVIHYLSVQNTIPNASAILFRKELLNFDKINSFLYYKMCGDWFFYIQALLSYPENKIAYYVAKLNCFVRHNGSVFGQSSKNSPYLSEILKIYIYLLKSLQLPQDNIVLMLKEIVSAISWYSYDQDLEDELKEYLSLVMLKIPYNIFIETIAQQGSEQLKKDLAWQKQQTDKYWQESEKLKNILQPRPGLYLRKLLGYTRVLAKIFTRK